MSVPHEHIMQFFSYEHLLQPLQDISRPFCELALQLEQTLPRNPERTVALRKVLEAKDEAVRAYYSAQPHVTEPQMDALIEGFSYLHLPDELHLVSILFHDVALSTLAHLQPNRRRAMAIDKLCEAKDAAVRAKLARDVQRDPRDPREPQTITPADVGAVEDVLKQP
jgi:hypothetical protein